MHVDLDQASDRVGEDERHVTPPDPDDIKDAGALRAVAGVLAQALLADAVPADAAVEELEAQAAEADEGAERQRTGLARVQLAILEEDAVPSPAQSAAHRCA